MTRWTRAHVPRSYRTDLGQGIMSTFNDGLDLVVQDMDGVWPSAVEPRTNRYWLERFGAAALCEALGQEDEREIVQWLTTAAARSRQTSRYTKDHIENWFKAVIGPDVELVEFPQLTMMQELKIESGGTIMVENRGSSDTTLSIDVIVHNSAQFLVLENLTNDSKMTLDAALGQGDRLLIDRNNAKLNADKRELRSNGKGLVLSPGPNRIHFYDGTEPLDRFRLGSSVLTGDPLKLVGKVEWKESCRASVQLRVPLSSLDPNCTREDLERLRETLVHRLQNMVVAGVNPEVTFIT